MTQEELAGRVAKDRATIANSIRLLRLPPAVKLLVAEGSLSPGHARALLASDAGESEMARVSKLVVEQSWSVRDAERWAQKQTKGTRLRKPLDPDTQAAAGKLRLILGTKVEILPSRGGKGAGRILIHYYSTEDLDRIYGILTIKQSYQAEGTT